MQKMGEFFGKPEISVIFLSLFVILVFFGFMLDFAFADVKTNLNQPTPSGSFIAIGLDGNPIIGFTGEFNSPIRIIHCTNPSCSTHDFNTNLDNSSGSKSKPSLAIGSDGFPIIIYGDTKSRDIHNFNLIHCTNPSCSTHDSPLILSNSTFPFSDLSIAIGTDGNPIVSYTEKPDDGILKVIHCTNVSCSSHTAPVVLDNTGDNHDSSIAIGDDGFPIISYADGNGGGLYMIHCTTVSCSEFDSPVSLDNISVRHISMTIGNDANPLISYFDISNDDLKLVHCTNPSCSTHDSPVILDSIGRVGLYTSIAIASDGNPIISYYADENTNPGLRVVHCTNTSCSDHDLPVILDRFPGYETSMAIGADGKPVISFHNEIDSRIRVVQCSNPTCSYSENLWGDPKRLDTIGSVGVKSMVLSKKGFPIVSYSDNTNGNLKLMFCTNPSCRTQDPPIILDNSTMVGTHTSLGINHMGKPVISYYDSFNDDLKIISCNTISCSFINTPIVADSGGNVGQYSSLAMGDIELAISYHDVTNGDLKFVSCTSSSCTNVNTPITLDKEGIVGRFTSIKYGFDNNPIISYYGVTNSDLRVYHCPNSSCSNSSVPSILDFVGLVGAYTSMEIGIDGNPIISYYDATNGALRAVHCTTTSCSSHDPPVTLDSDGTVGLYTSITIAGNGDPLISYYDSTNGDLKYVRCTNLSCSSNNPPITLDSEGDVGQFSSIIINNNNLPMISYWDVTNQDLKVISQFENCSAPNSGTWNIGHDCTISANSISPEDMVIQNNSLVTISPEATLDIDFTNQNLTVKSGSSVLIKFGGKII